MRRRGRTKPSGGGAHPILRAAAPRHEARAVLADFAILYRGNHQARVFEQALRRRRSRTRFRAASAFRPRRDQGPVAYLRLLVNDDDDPAFLRAVTTPKRGIGHQTLAEPRRIRAAQQARACSRRCSPSRSPTALPRARDRRRCTSSAAASTTLHIARRRDRRRGREALRSSWLKDIGYEAHLHESEYQPALRRAAGPRARLRRLAREGCGGDDSDDDRRRRGERKSVLASRRRSR